MPTSWLDTILKQTRRLGDFPYPHQLAFALDNPLRRLMTDPASLADRLHLTGGERVLELGPGPGFFSAEIARRLPAGRIDLFDLQPQMLAKARAKLERAGFRNTGFHAGEAGAEFPFPDNTFDVAFLASVLGEVPNPSACIDELFRVLKPGARLVFFEAFPDPDRLSISTLRELAEPQGFSLTSAQGTRWSDLVTFTRPA